MRLDPLIWSWKTRLAILAGILLSMVGLGFLGETTILGSLAFLRILHVVGLILALCAGAILLRAACRPVLFRSALAFVGLASTMAFTMMAVQYANFTPQCSGTNDTAAFSAIISTIGSATGSIKIPWVLSTRCAVNDLTIPINVALDFSNTTGIKVNNSKTLTLHAFNAPMHKVFYNALSGQGSVVIASNVEQIYSEWWGAKADGSTDCTSAITAAMSAFPSNQPGINGGIIKFGIGNYRVAGLTITDQQVHLIGSGGPGVLGSVVTATTVISSVTNAPIIKYASSVEVYNQRARLENLTVVGSVSAGTSQHGVWVDNNGILMNNVGIQATGGHGLYITKSSTGGYSNLEINTTHLDGVRVNFAASADSGAGCHNNVFFRISIGNAGQTGFHIMHGDGNVVFGLDVEFSIGRGLWIEYPGDGKLEPRFSNILGYWDEANGLPMEFQGATQNNYVQFVHNSTGAPVVGSTSVGNRFDNVPVYGTPQTIQFPWVVIGKDSAQQAGQDSLLVSEGHFWFTNSGQRIKWSTDGSLAQIGVASSTTFQILNGAGTGAGNLLLGTPDASHPALAASGANLAARLGDESGYTGVIASKFCFAGTTICDFVGSGSPESAVTASVGSTYRRSNGGTSTSFYVKETGSGNTGWIAK